MGQLSIWHLNADDEEKVNNIYVLCSVKKCIAIFATNTNDKWSK